MDSFTKKCIQDHRNPIVKVSLPAQKLFHSAKTEEEKKLINEHQEHFGIILEHQRIEKRSVRAQALWLPSDNIAKVTKVAKNLVKYFGFQNKNGVFLHPEEMLFLLETNRLEITFEANVFSIEKAYETVFRTTNISLPKYRIYKNLALLGFKLIRFDQIDNKSPNKKKKEALKRVLEDATDESQASKRIKDYILPKAVENVSEDSYQSEVNDQTCLQSEKVILKDAQHVNEILGRIRKIMPRDSCNESNLLKPDYCIFLPTNIAKLEPDFNLFICEGNILDQRNFNCKLPSIYSSCIDDVAFYRFSDVHLPYI